MSDELCRSELLCDETAQHAKRRGPHPVSPIATRQRPSPARALARSQIQPRAAKYASASSYQAGAAAGLPSASASAAAAHHREVTAAGRTRRYRTVEDPVGEGEVADGQRGPDILHGREHQPPSGSASSASTVTPSCCLGIVAVEGGPIARKITKPVLGNPTPRAAATRPSGLAIGSPRSKLHRAIDRSHHVIA